jgi:hypothetical protein
MMMNDSGHIPEGVLRLPVEFMPFEDLGSTINPMILRDLNGSFLPFNPNDQRILFAMLWSLPSGDESEDMTTRNTRNRRRSPAMDPMMMDPMMGMMGGPGMGPSPRTRSSDEMLVPEIAYDLATNMDQYNEFFAKRIMSGKVNFMSLNIDREIDAPSLVSMIRNNNWPWVNCLLADPINTNQWPLEIKTAPVMVMIDTKSNVRYVGPVGGFLPHMLVDREWPRARTSNIATGDIQKLIAGAGVVTGTASGSRGGQPARTETSEPSVEPEPEPESVVKERKSDPQAKKMLQTAYIQKKLSPRSALKSCDNVIERYPDSLEAEEAELLINSILRTNPSLEKERQRKASQG